MSSELDNVFIDHKNIDPDIEYNPEQVFERFTVTFFAEYEDNIDINKNIKLWIQAIEVYEKQHENRIEMIDNKFVLFHQHLT